MEFQPELIQPLSLSQLLQSHYLLLVKKTFLFYHRISWICLSVFLMYALPVPAASRTKDCTPGSSVHPMHSFIFNLCFFFALAGMISYRNQLSGVERQC